MSARGLELLQFPIPVPQTPHFGIALLPGSCPGDGAGLHSIGSLGAMPSGVVAEPEVTSAPQVM